jgi:hypothetical protein
MASASHGRSGQTFMVVRSAALIAPDRVHPPDRRGDCWCTFDVGGPAEDAVSNARPAGRGAGSGQHDGVASTKRSSDCEYSLGCARDSGVGSPVDRGAVEILGELRVRSDRGRARAPARPACARSRLTTTAHRGRPRNCHCGNLAAPRLPPRTGAQSSCGCDRQIAEGDDSGTRADVVLRTYDRRLSSANGENRIHHVVARHVSTTASEAGTHRRDRGARPRFRPSRSPRSSLDTGAARTTRRLQDGPPTPGSGITSQPPARRRLGERVTSVQRSERARSCALTACLNPVGMAPLGVRRGGPKPPCRCSRSAFAQRSSAPRSRLRSIRSRMASPAWVSAS